MLVSTVNLYIPPAAQGVIDAIEAIGYQVKVRQTRNGSNRYSVNGTSEIDANTFIKRFDAGKYPSNRDSMGNLLSGESDPHA